MLSNPFDQSVIVDIGFATDEGSREPPELQGFPIAPRSVQVIDLDSIAARDEAQVAVRVDAPRDARSPGGPSSTTAADGSVQHDAGVADAAVAVVVRQRQQGRGTSERFSIYNPTTDAVQVAPLYLGPGGRRSPSTRSPCRRGSS